MYQSKCSKLKKTSDHRNSLSKEEISYSAPELEIGREYREEERVIKEIPGSPTSKTSEGYKRLVEEDAKYIVPKMDVTYSLREEEDKEEETDVMPNSGTIRKSNRIKNPSSAKLDVFYGQFKPE
jgi:predicted Rossmann fold nucleotide-binding protein DprA/Smf involved in DNA uptake